MFLAMIDIFRLGNYMKCIYLGRYMINAVLHISILNIKHHVGTSIINTNQIDIFNFHVMATSQVLLATVSNLAGVIALIGQTAIVLWIGLVLNKRVSRGVFCAEFDVSKSMYKVSHVLIGRYTWHNFSWINHMMPSGVYVSSSHAEIPNKLTYIIHMCYGFDMYLLQRWQP